MALSLRQHALAISLTLLGAARTSPAETPRFTDVTHLTGIRLNPEHRPNQPSYGTQCPHGVAVEDFDRDGMVDILVVCFGKPHVRLFRNRGCFRFSDVTEGSGLESFRGWGSGAAAGDYDGDGELDVYLTSVAADKKHRGISPPGGESRLFRGLGGGMFQDVSTTSGTILTVPARSCAWSDVDADGWLDLFVTCPYAANVLFRNNRDGTFTDIATEAAIGLRDRMSVGCAFGDVDGDGRDDLFVTNYDSQISALFKNVGSGRFRDMTAAAGLDRRASSVGCAFADVFNRGRLDLYVTTDSWLSGANYTEDELLERGHTVEPNALFINDGRGRFRSASDPALSYKALCHDAALDDFDHDGLVDIYVGLDAIPSGNRFATHRGGNPAWTRTDGETWTDVRADWNVAFEGNCVCVPAADFDNDGDLDLLLINFYKNLVLYRNNTDDRNWLRIKAAGARGNRDGIGAQVRVYAGSRSGRRLVALRQIQSGSGYCRSSLLEAHVGLGRSPAAAYRVEVRFPVSQTIVVREHVKSGQSLVIGEKE